MRTVLLGLCMVALAACIRGPDLPSVPTVSVPADIGASTRPAPEDPDPLHWAGDVFVDRSIRLLPWQTLRIEPGTTVHVAKGVYIEGTDWVPEADAFIKDHDDPTGRYGYRQSHHQIYGRIEALGTQEQPIRFTSAAPTPEYADWNNLILLDGSRLENVSVSFLHNGIQLQGDGITLHNVTVHDSLWSCIDVFSVDNLLQDVEAYHCWHQAVGFKKAGANLLQRAFLHDGTLAVNCEHGADPRLVDLTIRAAPIGPDCPAPDPLLELPGGPDVAGGTFQGRLIYPAGS